jgi:hypothetical protein
VSAVDESRWSCPRCNRTVSVYASPPDARAALDAIQARHTKAHRETALAAARATLPNPLRPAKKRSA